MNQNWLKCALKRDYSITSKAQWANRQATDLYVQKRIALGLRSRSAFKLEQLQAKYRFIKPGMALLDLGAAPGGWSQIAARHLFHIASNDLSLEPPQPIDFSQEKGLILAVDILPMEPMQGVTIFQGDFHSKELQSQISHTLSSRCRNQFDVIVSDMAHSFTGHRVADVPAVHALCFEALEYSKKRLRVNGTLVVKCLDGEGDHLVMDAFKSTFKTVKTFKPKASRSTSSEFYIIGLKKCLSPSLITSTRE